MKDCKNMPICKKLISPASHQLHIICLYMMLKTVMLLTALAVSSAVLKFPLNKIPDHEFVQSVVARAAEGRK